MGLAASGSAEKETHARAAGIAGLSPAASSAASWLFGSVVPPSVFPIMHAVDGRNDRLGLFPYHLQAAGQQSWLAALLPDACLRAHI